MIEAVDTTVDMVRDLMSRAHDALIHIADRDGCYCCDREEEVVCSIDNPQCDVAHARAAMRYLDQVLTPPMLTLQPNRLTHPPERIYFQHWAKENERRSWLNSGFTLLEHILTPSGQKRPECVSHRDAIVATSVIQWLGTSCGRGFMEHCEREIERERADRGEIQHVAWQSTVNAHHGSGRTSRIAALDSCAQSLAGRYWPATKPDFTSAETMLAEALHRAYEMGRRHAERELVTNDYV
jgi:hypothetical protein